jgi:hypothetical protein
MAKPQRKERVPVNGAKDILTVAERLKDPNYEYRFVVDTPGRIMRFNDGGWEIVKDETMQVGQTAVDSGSRLGSAVTVSRGGQVLVLMRIPKEWYDEDQLAKQEKVDALESTMNADLKAGRIDGQPGFYGGQMDVRVTKSAR